VLVFKREVGWHEVVEQRPQAESKPSAHGAILAEIGGRKKKVAARVAIPFAGNDILDSVTGIR
jgi:hypothetical protein